MSFTTIINKTQNPLRADVLLASFYPQYSRAALTKLFDMNLIQKNSVAIKAGEKIQPNISIFADISPIEQVADVIDIPIIYQDDNIIVVNKPAGMISHARGKYWDEASVASFIRDKVSGMVGERAGIVHRLDRATSGVMVCAKNTDTLSFIQKQFSKRSVQKTYIAIVNGDIEPKKGIIDIPLARNPSKPQTFVVNANGKSAQTEYQVTYQEGNFSALQLHPLTGRTHQLRIHLQYLNKPIVGDTLYGGQKNERLMLHAHSITINSPDKGIQTFKAPLPKDFTNLCSQLSTL
ncbi:MAG: rRNA synthase [Patescibacteria group bacterium]|nr:rRNA synthase [Patescibacteria group bacterium]MDQ5953822.1 rRNA synthase [Patescibacteria group bacterium]MDQ5958316.1 rRNA synthase [Patescibacteria group bacterium]